MIIGGGPAALSAAHSYRAAGGDGEILMISADTEPPYHRLWLSKELLRDEVSDDELPLEGWEFYRDQRINLVLDDPVIALDPAASKLNTASGRTVRYRHCLLAPGAEPLRPSVPGVHHPRVLALRSAANGRELRRAARNTRSVVVVGAGFIGCEAAVSLSRLGLQVTMLCRDELPHRRLGADVGRKVLRWLGSEGVSVRTGTTLRAIDDGYRVRTDRIPLLDTGFVLLATGVRPRVELAERAGLMLAQGRVCTDEYLRTSAAGVLAAGDVALAYNATAARPIAVEHWGDAVTTGAIAGRTAAGHLARWTSTPGFRSVVGDRELRYSAWGDGFDHTEYVEHGHGAFTVWYGRDGVTAGVLTHNADEDFERGRTLVEQRRPLDLVST